MSNILNSKAKLQTALMEVTNRLAKAAHVLTLMQNAPPYHTWSDDDKAVMKKLIDEALEEAHKELNV